METSPGSSRRHHVGDSRRRTSLSSVGTAAGVKWITSTASRAQAASCNQESSVVLPLPRGP